ncbi:MAG: hypothetical protein QOI70_537, partial [Microbacteriaceae bacterium]|nr:hypothetical protein [Microbacteriaceae bacterium]
FNGTASTDPDGSIAAYDWDFGDGSPHATVVSPSHTYAAAGAYSVTLVVTDDRGSSASVTHTVNVVKPNGAPTASFTASTSSLTVAVNGSASTDDGTISGYAWNFGDGSSGAGITASHTYAAAGDYTVSLTVTDNGGLTATASKPVTVSAGSTLAEDQFERTTASGWGAAGTGGQWTSSSTANSSVGAGTGVLSLTAGATRKVTLNGVSTTDADISTGISFDKAMTGGGAYAGIIARQTASDYYQSRIRFLANGTLAAQILQGGSTVLGNATVTGTYTPGTSLTLRTQISGASPTTVRAKVWPTGTAEPTAWAVTATSSAAGLQVAGSIGVESYASTSITNPPLLAKYDNYLASSGGAVVPPPPPAQNVPPTAAFTSSVSGLAATVDGGTSTDSDGTIVGYSWNFGDGSTGTGVTASHSYAAPGTYTVTLTVTDNSAATATKTGSVSVTAPPPGDPNLLASDDFERTTTAGWGNATVGGAWTSTTNASSFVNIGSGAFVHSVGATRRALLNGVSVRDVELQVQVASDKPVSAGQIVAGLVSRQVGTDFYQGRIRLLPSGVVALQLVHGSGTILADVTVAGLTYSPADQLMLKVRVTGASPTTIQARIWRAGAPEPTTWQATATDSTAALQAPGTVGLESYVSTSATNTPVTLRYDTFSARSAQ